MPERRVPTIAVLATGGTIAGVKTEGDTHAYRAGSLSVDHLLEAVPGLAQIARLQAEQLANVGSQNINFAIWADLARRVDVLCRDPAIDGIVITHGTDTIEETAYFLSLLISSDKPVILTGAMRPATALGADGPANIYDAVVVAGSAHARGRGPLVVMNGDIHDARGVQKTACTGINAFSSPNGGRAGEMRGGHPFFFTQSPRARRASDEFSLTLLDRPWPRVDILYAVVALNKDIVEYLSSRAQGLILAGVGDGNANENVVAALHRAATAGVAVVRSSRCGSAAVTRNVEIDDASLGFVAAGDLSPQKARVLLMLGLMKTSSAADLQSMFERF